MKSERIRLYPFDNIDSVLDKLNQTYQSVPGLDRLVLEFPKRGRVLVKPLEFGLVRGWAGIRNIQLVIIAANEMVRIRAVEQGIPVFPSVEAIPDSGLRRPIRVRDSKLSARRIADLIRLRQLVERVRERRPRSLMAIPLFLIGIWFAGFVFMTVLPRATLVLSPIPAERTLSFYLWTADALTELTTSGGIPSAEIRFHVSATTEIPTTGVVNLPPTFARGLLLVYNRCDSERYLPVGTRFLTPSSDLPEYRTTIEQTVPPGETVEVGVQADAAGEVGNLEPRTIDRIEPPFDRCIMTEQQFSFSGGTESVQSAVNDSDYQAALDLLSVSLSDAARERLSQFSDETQIALDHTLKFVEMIDERVDPPVGYAGDRLSVFQEAIFSVRVLSVSDIRSQAEMVFAASPLEGFRSRNVPIQFQLRSIPQDESSEQYYFKIEAVQAGFRDVDETIVADAVRGLRIDDAKSVLTAMYTEEVDPLILVWPSRFPNLPISSVNIRLEMRK